MLHVLFVVLKLILWTAFVCCASSSLGAIIFFWIARGINGGRLSALIGEAAGPILFTGLACFGLLKAIAPLSPNYRIAEFFIGAIFAGLIAVTFAMQSAARDSKFWHALFLLAIIASVGLYGAGAWLVITT